VIPDHTYHRVQMSANRKLDLDDSRMESGVDVDIVDLPDVDSEADLPSKLNELDCDFYKRTSWSAVSNSVLNFDLQCEADVVELFSEGEETLTSYLSGWVARKSGICKTCQQVLTKPDKEHSYECRAQDLFALKKRYNDSSTVGLINPSEDLFAVVRLMEQLFRLKYKAAMSKPDVVKSLFSDIYPKCDFSFLFVRHPEHALYLSEKITKLYLTMRMYYALKFYNCKLKAPAKSNESGSERRSVTKRKMKKILHD
jgi:hypothetical protein